MLTHRYTRRLPHERQPLALHLLDMEPNKRQRTICQICRMLSSDTLAATHSSFRFQLKSDTFAVCPPAQRVSEARQQC
jgi:hypothetical protein